MANSTAGPSPRLVVLVVGLVVVVFGLARSVYGGGGAGLGRPRDRGGGEHHAPESCGGFLRREDRAQQVEGDQGGEPGGVDGGVSEPGPRGFGVAGQDVAADDGDDPVGDDGQEHRGGGVGGHGPPAGGVGGGEVHPG